MRKKNYIILFLVMICGALYVLFFDKVHFKVPCLFHKITGLYCPGCGITRMFYYLLHLNFRKAFSSNQLVFCLIPFIIIYYIDYLLIKYKGKGFINLKLKKVLLWVILIVTIIFGIVRNIPYFSFLCP